MTPTQTNTDATCTVAEFISLLEKNLSSDGLDALRTKFKFQGKGEGIQLIFQVPEDSKTCLSLSILKLERYREVMRCFLSDGDRALFDRLVPLLQ